MRRLLLGCVLLLVAACGSESPTSPSFDAVSLSVHVGDIDATRQLFFCNSGKSYCEFQARWTFEVHQPDPIGADPLEPPPPPIPVSGVEVQYVFSSWKYAPAPLNCTTDATGRCTMGITGSLPKGKTGPASVTLRVTNVVRWGDPVTYDASANHDPDGSSNGTTLVLPILP